MSKRRLSALLLALVLAAVGLVGALTVSPAAAADCAAAWSSSAVYTGGATVSYNGRNWGAKWWTQGEAPSTGGSGVWEDRGSCGGGSPQPPDPGTCSHPNWAAGTWYPTGSIVRYTDGRYYIAEHDNPGYDPIISTWFWEPYPCGGTDPNPPGPGGFVVSEAQFNQMFPNRNALYTYQGLVNAMSAYPGFAKTGSTDTQKQEAAAFLANVGHETGGLVYTEEIDQSNWPHYCDWSQPYGCPAGQSAYHGRGPIQLSWNFNYKAAGDALGIDLLHNPDLVKNDAAIAWKTGLWYWNTQRGNAAQSSHDAIVNGRGFGETIRAINSIECNGGNPAQVQSRINNFQRFTQMLGTGTGPGALGC
jgi:chitinase